MDVDIKSPNLLSIVDAEKGVPRFLNTITFGALASLAATSQAFYKQISLFQASVEAFCDKKLCLPCINYIPDGKNKNMQDLFNMYYDFRINNLPPVFKDAFKFFKWDSEFLSKEVVCNPVNKSTIRVASDADGNTLVTSHSIISGLANTLFFKHEKWIGYEQIDTQQFPYLCKETTLSQEEQELSKGEKETFLSNSKTIQVYAKILASLITIGSDFHGLEFQNRDFSHFNLKDLRTNQEYGVVKDNNGCAFAAIEKDIETGSAAAKRTALFNQLSPIFKEILNSLELSSTLISNGSVQKETSAMGEKVMITTMKILESAKNTLIHIKMWQSDSNFNEHTLTFNDGKWLSYKVITPSPRGMVIRMHEKFSEKEQAITSEKVSFSGGNEEAYNFYGKYIGPVALTIAQLLVNRNTSSVNLFPDQSTGTKYRYYYDTQDKTFVFGPRK